MGFDGCERQASGRLMDTWLPFFACIYDDMTSFILLFDLIVHALLFPTFDPDNGHTFDWCLAIMKEKLGMELDLRGLH